MKANELRIGNYVAIEHCRYGEPYLTIESIGLESVNYDFRAYSVGEIKPIPLTEEWLVKFGFKLYPTGSYCKDINYDLYLAIIYSDTPKEIWLNVYQDGVENTTILKHIHYVHQLQNLYYALTGEELI